MMQQLAAKKTDIASNVQIGIASGSSEQPSYSGKGQDFASMLERSHAAEKTTPPPAYKNSNSTKSVQGSEKASNSVENTAATQQSAKQTEQSEAVAQQKNANDPGDSVAKKEATTDEQASTSQDQQDSVKAEGESAQNDSAEGQQDNAQQSAEPDEAQSELVQEAATHFDWLAMLDKLHGQGSDKAELESDGVKADVAVETDMQGELDKLLNGQFDAVQSDALKEGVSDIELITDMPTDEQSISNESLQEILAMIDSLSQKDDVSEEELLQLDAMIDQFLTQNPELQDSPLKELTGKDWLQIDSKFLTHLMSNVAGEQTVQADAEIKTDDPLLDKLVNADPTQLQKAAEHIANQVLPKESVSAEVKETFVDKLKAGVEELKSQAQQGQQSGNDLGQVVKDAVAAATGDNSSAAMDQAKLQQVLASTNSTMDMAAQLVDQKAGNAEMAKSVSAANAKEANVAQLESARQQAANQMDRTVNIHKPDAPQNLADKVQLMVNQKNMTADIRLDPPDLGTMKIKVNMSGEAATVNFVVQTQQAREALEHAAPRLKELLDEQGIQLGQSSVEQESKQQDAENANGQFAGGSGGSGNEVEEEFVEQQTVRMVNGSVNGIDYFA
ncbi:flagellar hook-length control protein FliK [Paraneptunicella aestuarii]|uniref:flagellar hook-length control protein FliK n=1 Tax=Paraneptunicella aestuarii TaxID=2831148 RepID=UPI001E59B92B|nr:flagellar hook-length control protein FliK [Paraneptunicella aestuarii]UAA38164.1 flagellar hook-length control protein FliK [Paraneptunicella aestuarii]